MICRVKHMLWFAMSSYNFLKIIPDYSIYIRWFLIYLTQCSIKRYGNKYTYINDLFHADVHLIIKMNAN